MQQQATAALMRWDDAVNRFDGPVLLPLGAPFGEIGNWNSPAAAKVRLSVQNGRFDLAANLPKNPSATAAVRLTDGKTVILPSVSAHEAWVAAPRPQGFCRDCQTLHIVGAHLGSGALQTTHGSVTMPLWEYQIEGAEIELSRPAVALPQPVVTPPPWDPNKPPFGIQAETAMGSVTSRSLTVTFVGALDGAAKPCGSDYSADAVESVAAVVVIIHQRRHSATEICSDVGFPRYTTVALASPLGERTILDDREGMPVPTIRLS